MAIRKQEFYEGAAIYLLARSGKLQSIRYEQPFFFVNGGLCLLLKYSTRKRSPWAFTFTIDEQTLMTSCVSRDVMIGLICGSDGIAALPFEAFAEIAANRTSAVHVACYRGHNKHYEVSGPDGTLKRKIAPSDWRRFLEVKEHLYEPS